MERYWFFRRFTLAECERLATCPFFLRLSFLPKTAEGLVQIYCRADHKSCARYKVISAGILPPQDLFPDESERAMRIVNRSQKP
jgi:hypothetical protein